jgi:hypothetical protein
MYIIIIKYRNGMSNLKTEKRCQTSRRNIGTCDSDVNVLSCCKFAEHVHPRFRNSAELRRVMFIVGWPEAVLCRTSVAMLARVTRLLDDCASGGTHCNEIRLLGLR